MLSGFRKKNIVLILLILLSLLLCYKLAISNTLALKREYGALTKEEGLYKNIPQQLSLLSKKEAYLDTVLQDLNINNTSMENNLLRIINQEVSKNQLSLIDYNPAHISKQNETNFITYNFTLRGSFPSILKAIYSIEKHSGFGEIIHVDFTKEKNYKTRRNFLEASIYIQSLE
ncbi:hypothetical protein [Flagellimonas sp. S3867]|uniref:hypothetical protein n=1 Tax=Flagellimonas sp. S3867 TaxID=2768063 RepID=UPI0016847C21|nr:hypothetical protein [Flagellimonas sp. S3867]